MFELMWDWFCNNILLQPWFYPVTLVIGGVWALIVYTLSAKKDRKSIELLNQPKFEFYDSMNSYERISSSVDSLKSNNSKRPMPDTCCNPTCNKLHWFDVKNNGKFPAQNFSISMVLDEEDDFRKKLSERIMIDNHLQSGESLQYTLNTTNNISVKYLNAKDFGYPLYFYVFIQYKSEYSKFWYRRVYVLDATKIIESEVDTWAENIEFYNITEDRYSCKKYINIFTKIKSFKTSKKHLTLEQYASNWVNDYKNFNQNKNIFD